MLQEEVCGQVQTSLAANNEGPRDQTAHDGGEQADRLVTKITAERRRPDV
jgi:hypothetical protein